MIKRELIEKLKELRVITNKSVTLTSGRKSDYYCDIKKALGYPDVLSLMVELLAENQFVKQSTCIATLGYGGMPLGTALSRETGKRLISIRDTKKRYGTESQIEGYIPKGSDKVVVVDDVLTTGRSLGFAKEIIEKETGAEVVGGVVVVKRESPELPIEINSLIEIDELR